MTPTTQKALLVVSKGANFVLATRPVPKPGPRQVLIKVESVALNPLDWAVTTRGLLMKSFPSVGGSDGAGTIEGLGEGATGVQKGDRVLFQCLDYTSDRGAFQQYAIADAHRISKIPSNLSFDEAATVPLGLATAAVGLYAPKAPMGGAALTPPWVEGGKDKYKDQPALVTGGSSSVGQFGEVTCSLMSHKAPTHIQSLNSPAIQLLKLSGFNPIISTSSARNFDYVRVAGATHVIDYHTTPYASLRAAVEKITSAPIPVIYDAISSEDSQRACWDILAPNGAIVVTTGMRQPVVGKPGEDAEDGKHLARVYGSVDIVKDVEFGNQLHASLTGLLESGALKPNKVEILSNGLAGVLDGVARFGRGEVSGVKLVAHVDATP
ncbi:hypothetical protein EVG20_g4723 [Dentipellis fragilis]|uniref:Enoyl reductase (ER) domain-containing protein n=1 Tax=Dentipellis fragilis TaxID=205917 RepID=A0A4Y9YX90_9AGAM|nr:hypothetical protein EVG20_g4723 [Dentipellis fragilis]